MGGDSRRISRGATGRDGHLTPFAIVTRRYRTTEESVTARSRRRMDAGGGHVRRERDVRQIPEGRRGCTFHE